MSTILAFLFSVGAPVPLHLMREPDKDLLSPGFRWGYQGYGEHGPVVYELEVVFLEGDYVVFRCVNDPRKHWCQHPLSPPWQVWSVQTKAKTLEEIKLYGVPQHPFQEPPRGETWLGPRSLPR